MADQPVVGEDFVGILVVGETDAEAGPGREQEADERVHGKWLAQPQFQPAKADAQECDRGNDPLEGREAFDQPVIIEPEKGVPQGILRGRQAVLDEESDGEPSEHCQVGHFPALEYGIQHGNYDHRPHKPPAQRDEPQAVPARFREQRTHGHGQQERDRIAYQYLHVAHMDEQQQGRDETECIQGALLSGGPPYGLLQQYGEPGEHQGARPADIE